MWSLLLIQHIYGLKHLIKREEVLSLNIFPFSKTFTCQMK